MLSSLTTHRPPRLQPVAPRLALLLMGVWVTGVSARTLHVGPDQPYDRPEIACADAEPGDTILVHPQPDNAAYTKVALQIRKPRLTLRAVRTDDQPRIPFDGAGFNYSGRGSVPRGIVQFNPDADGGTLEGFELRRAGNEAHNGAGVRINQADDITIRDCEIHGNDMGVMSNGSAGAESGARQRLIACRIHRNGDAEDPGYNHNLYLGGTSVQLLGCEVSHATTGHNIKSRAHLTWIEACYVHDSANRELDLVDAEGNTDLPDSHAVVLGSVIVKKPKLQGNRAVIHFGRDGRADHIGTLFLVHNTIISPYRSPVVDLSASGAGLMMANNLIHAPGEQANRTLVKLRKGVEPDRIAGRHNWLDPQHRWPDTVAIQPSIAPAEQQPTFVAPANGDYRPSPDTAPLLNRGLPWREIALPVFKVPARRQPLTKLHHFTPPLSAEPRSITGRPDLGAYEAVPLSSGE